MRFDIYETGGFYDEVLDVEGRPRTHCEPLVRKLEALSREEIIRRQKAAELALLNLGITFNVYGHEAGTEKIFPFDIIPRVVPARDWAIIQAGLTQRVRALNCFIDDVYTRGRILRDRVIPRGLVESGIFYLPQCRDLLPPRGIWCHVVGTDLVRGADGQFYVLEDNLRSPSGVSYVLENRQIMKRTFPQVFSQMRIHQIDDYPSRLLACLHHVSPRNGGETTAVVLTPGMYNSAYFEHSFLAQQMGIPLVEGRDLIVRRNELLMRTTHRFERVDVIYRRIDDTFLDPTVFRPDSVLGVPGLMELYRKRRVSIVNAPGTGIADDKVIYRFVPEMIRYYLGEEPLLPNVPTFICALDDERDHVLRNLDRLVIKSANESGGYGMLIGPQATPEERDAFAVKILKDPRNYLAQPLIPLSRVPCLIGDRLEGRHVDLRPYVISGKDIFVLPGGLTRVALTEGSYVVNSSQGGGSKDTWVMLDEPRPGVVEPLQGEGQTC
jgi:uncharacterized circularly permuted ATP-grasp superfamily protein